MSYRLTITPGHGGNRVSLQGVCIVNGNPAWSEIDALHVELGDTFSVISKGDDRVSLYHPPHHSPSPTQLPQEATVSEGEV